MVWGPSQIQVRFEGRYDRCDPSVGPNQTGAFKRATLGWFGKSIVKTAEELAKILVDSKVARSLEEATAFMPQLVGERISYGRKEIVFSEFPNARGGTDYRIDLVQAARSDSEGYNGD